MRDMVARGRQAQGVRHPQSKFTEEEVRAIRSSTLSQRQLAKRYGVHDMTIHKIKQGSSYKDV